MNSADDRLRGTTPLEGAPHAAKRPAGVVRWLRVKIHRYLAFRDTAMPFGTNIVHTHTFNLRDGTTVVPPAGGSGGGLPTFQR